MSSSIKTEVRQKVSATFNFEGRELTISFYGEGEFLSRLVACWNACQVITDPENVVPRLLALNELVPNLEHQAATLRVQRDELLAALKEARRWIGDGECSDGLAREHWTQEYRAAVDRIDAAVAKVTGEQT